jgi:hypothetical protein
MHCSTLRFPRAARWLRRALALAAVLACGSCGSEPTPPCQTMPQSCGAGMTCWPTDMGGMFQCLASKAYAPLGTECAILVGLTTCADGLICAPMTGKNSVKTNRCTTYCDPNTPCSAGATCTPVSLFPIAPQISVCILPPPT